MPNAHPKGCSFLASEYIYVCVYVALIHSLQTCNVGGKMLGNNTMKLCCILAMKFWCCILAKSGELGNKRKSGTQPTVFFVVIPTYSWLWQPPISTHGCGNPSNQSLGLFP